MQIKYLFNELDFSENVINTIKLYLSNEELIYFSGQDNWNKFSEKEICNISARNNWLDLLKWARKYYLDSEWSANTSCLAALNGNLEMLIWMIQNGCEWDARICSRAARNNHLELLKWAIDNCCEWDSWTCACAARNNNLELLQWAKANGCEFDKWTFILAAQNGHIRILEWAKQNNCEWDDEVCSYAAENGQLEVLKWAKKIIILQMIKLTSWQLKMDI